MNWKKIKSIILSAIGVADLPDNRLTPDQESTVKEVFGPDVLDRFKAAIAADSPETAAADIHRAMKAFFAPQAEEAASRAAEQLRTARDENKRLRDINAALMAAPEDIPPAEQPEPRGKDTAPKVMSTARGAEHYAAAAGFLASGSMLAAQGKTIDVGDLRQEFGTYLSQNQNNLEIVRQLFTGFTSAGYFRSVPAVTEYRAMQSQINSVVQQFTPKWTPKGSTKFTPLTIKNRRHKINVPIIPAEVLDSYLFHLYDERLAPDQMPITKYIWEQLIYPQILDDIELRMIFKGKYEETADPDAPTDPEQGMDGIETILVEQKASGTSRINFSAQNINWTTATDQEVLAFFEAFVDNLKPLYRNKKMNIYVAPETYRRYQRAYKKVWGANSGQAGDFGTVQIDYSQNTLVALDGMAGSPIVFSTPAENMVKLRHKNEVPLVINDVQKHDYEVRLYGEFWLAVGFLIAEAVTAYVPNGYNPRAALRPASQFPDGTAPKTGTGSASGGI